MVILAPILVILFLPGRGTIHAEGATRVPPWNRKAAGREEERTAMSTDGRPRLAVGHVSLEVEDVADACAFFVRHGMRDIFTGENFGVLELRGGTHLVLSRAETTVEPGLDAPFDLMVDDIDEARAEFTGNGVSATEIKRGRIHDTFHIEGPGGYRFAVTSSHAGDREV